MFLYFNGDSFVVGSELGDDILPGYPGLRELVITQDAVPYINWFTKTYSEARDTATQKRIFELERERSFPTKIAKKLNLPFLNNAIGGSSMDRIARTTIADLIKLKKDNINNIVAVIGTTDWGRSEIAVAEKDFKKNTWQCILPVFVEHAETLEVEYLRKYKVLNETDYHQMINFYKNIILVKDFCDLNDIQLFWISGASNVNNIAELDKLLKYEDYANYKQYANLNFTIDMRECAAVNFKGQLVRCPGGHFAELIHDFVADNLVELIKNISWD